MSTQYRTPSTLARIHKSGWVKLASGVLVTALPLVVAGEERMLAHLDYRQACEVAQSFSAELIDYDTVQELHDVASRVGLELPVLSLPDREMIAANPRRPGESQHAWLLRLYSPMGSEVWCRYADRKIFAELERRQWDGLEGQATFPVANAGKHFQKGAPVGRCYIRGWWSNDRKDDHGHALPPGFIQAGVPPSQVGRAPGPHGWWQCDYGTTTVLMKRAA